MLSGVSRRTSWDKEEKVEEQRGSRWRGSWSSPRTSWATRGGAGMKDEVTAEGGACSPTMGHPQWPLPKGSGTLSSRFRRRQRFARNGRELPRSRWFCRRRGELQPHQGAREGEGRRSGVRRTPGGVGTLWRAEGVVTAGGAGRARSVGAAFEGPSEEELPWRASRGREWQRQGQWRQGEWQGQGRRGGPLMFLLPRASVLGLGQSRAALAAGRRADGRFARRGYGFGRACGASPRGGESSSAPLPFRAASPWRKRGPSNPYRASSARSLGGGGPAPKTSGPRPVRCGTASRRGSSVSWGPRRAVRELSSPH